MSDRITWSGENTEDVVDFCVSWDYSLCHIHREYINLTTKARTLEIEPADTMRGNCLDIALGSECQRAEKSNRRFIVVIAPEK